MGTIGPIMGTIPSSIGSALFGLTRQRVLSLLYGRPDARFFLNALVREAGLGKGTVQRELESLVAAGLVESSVEGRQRYFRASRESPVFAELEALVRKTFGLVDVLKVALAPLASRIRFAGVYGSMARGTANARSDVDLLVVGDVDYLALAAALVEPEMALGRAINPTVMTLAEWRTRRKEKSGFVADVLSKPLIPILGAVDELAESRADRPARRAAARPTGDRKTARRSAPAARRRRTR